MNFATNILCLNPDTMIVQTNRCPAPTGKEVDASQNAAMMASLGAAYGKIFDSYVKWSHQTSQPFLWAPRQRTTGFKVIPAAPIFTGVELDPLCVLSSAQWRAQSAAMAEQNGIRISLNVPRWTIHKRLDPQLNLDYEARVEMVRTELGFAPDIFVSNNGGAMMETVMLASFSPDWLAKPRSSRHFSLPACKNTQTAESVRADNLNALYGR